MEKYIQHWWAGDVAQHYIFFMLSIPQLNKLAKLGQYLSGTLVLFDFVAFSLVMGQLKVISFFTMASYRVWQLLLAAPAYVTGSVSMLALVVTHRHRLRRMPWIFASRVRQKVFASIASAHTSYPVRFFHWLQLHPVPDRTIKAANFCLFLVFSATEIFTS
jgi:hypothetical protein